MSTDDDVYVLKGEVIDTSRLSHTEVWSSGGGGGGYVGPHGGHVRVSALEVHSQAVTTTDIYLRDANGKEHHIRVDRQDIPMRAGHHLAVAHVKEGGDWVPAVLLNVTTDKYWMLSCGATSSLTGCLSVPMALAGSGLVMVAFLLFIYAMFGAFVVGDAKEARAAGIWTVICGVTGYPLLAWTDKLVNGPKRRSWARAMSALGINSA